MIRLSREVRFAVNAVEDGQLAGSPTNSYGGFPSLTGIGHYFSLEVTLVGTADPATGYLLNIKDIDHVVRKQAIPLVNVFLQRARTAGVGTLLVKLFDLLRNCWPGAVVHHLRLALSPFMQLTIFAREYPMIRLCQKFEFSASHRLFNPTLSDDENRRIFGKCANPHGHGHNYILQVTLAGKPDANGVLVEVPKFEQVVANTIIEPFDHKNLNVEIPQFAALNPSVENIAMVIYQLLKPNLEFPNSRLAGITVWETPKTWCEYME